MTTVRPRSAPAPVSLVSLVALVLAALVVTLAPASPAGAAGLTVAQAQRRLAALGCDPGRADGELGAWTRAAVVRFQSRHAMAQTGRLDATTRQRLAASSAARCDRRPVPAASGTGRRIVASQRQNWVWLVGADGSVLAQGGMVDNPAELRPGSYATGSYCGRAARVVRNRSGSLWLDHFVRFAACGFGFHRIPRSMSTGEQIHADHFLGTDTFRSHGCFRVSSRMARTVWDFTASRRTTVRVVRG